MSDSEVVSTAPAIAVPAANVVPPTTSAAPSEAPAVGTTPEPIIETPKVLSAEELQKNFDRAAAMQRRKYDREIREEREARIRLEEQVRHLQPVSRETANAEPQLKDFEDFEAYVTAKSESVAERKIQETLSKQNERIATEKAQAAQQQSAEGFQKAVAELENEMPGVGERLANEGAEVPMSRAMQQAIIESPVGAKVAVYLLDHPDEAVKISGMTPIGAVRALTLIEEGLKKPVAVTQATPPITPTGSRSTAIKSLSDITSQAEFDKRRREYIAKRR